MDGGTITLLAISVLVVLANTAVCLLVVTKKRLRTYTNGFVVSLAVSDILTGGVFMPLNLLDAMNIASGFVNMLVITSSTCNLSAVAFDRYLAVVKPLAYKTKIASSFVRLVCAVWGITLIMTLLPLTWKVNPELLVHKVYLTCAVVLFLILPLIFILMVYTYIFICLRRHGKLLRSMQATLSKLDEARKSRRESKTVKMFFSIVALFLISWFPVIIMSLAYVANKPVPEFVFTISNFSITFSSLTNPFLYTFMKMDFRAEVVALFGCKRDKTPKREYSTYGRFNRRSSSLPITKTTSFNGEKQDENVSEEEV